MIPLRDNIRSQKTPFVSYTLLIINITIYAIQVSMDDGGSGILNVFGAIPANITGFFNDPTVSFFDAWFPMISYMFVHGGFMHIAGNMVFLWVFADNVEDFFGHVAFLCFYLICGIGALFIQVLFSWSSSGYIVGASGALAGVMGAYLVLYPHAKVKTFVPVFVVFLVDIPAVVFLGFWILLQFISASSGEEGVAWWAHIGGFFIGIMLLYFYRKYINKGKPPGVESDKFHIIYN